MIKKKFYFSLLVTLSIGISNAQQIDTLEFQKGFPNNSPSAIEQLLSFPSARYKSGNDLIRLFNWMNPNYMGSGGQPGITQKQSIENAFKLQEELILHWNYFIFIPNSTFAFNPKSFTEKNSMLYSYVQACKQISEYTIRNNDFLASATAAQTRLHTKKT